MELLDRAEQLASKFSGGYSEEFDSAEEFHRELLATINRLKEGDRSQLNRLHTWFLPTSCWDDFIGKEGQSLANEINEILSK